MISFIKRYTLYAAFAAFTALAVVASALYASLASGAKHNNVYRSPYVIVERKVSDDTFGKGSVSCSGFLFTYRGYTFIMTASHLYWTFDAGNPSELVSEDKRLTFVYNAKYDRLGVAFPIYNDVCRDISILAAPHETYHHPYGSFELMPMTLEELEEAVGDDVYFLGACNVGSWFTGVKSLQPFSEKTIISRVFSCVMDCVKHCPDAKPMTCIFVKGGGWFGCSGGPLLYRGKVIGVASVLESFEMKTGSAYSSVYEVCKEYLDKLPELNAGGKNGGK